MQQSWKGVETIILPRPAAPIRRSMRVLSAWGVRIVDAGREEARSGGWAPHSTPPLQPRHRKGLISNGPGVWRYKRSTNGRVELLQAIHCLLLLRLLLRMAVVVWIRQGNDKPTVKERRPSSPLLLLLPRDNHAVMFQYHPHPPRRATTTTVISLLKHPHSLHRSSSSKVHPPLGGVPLCSVSPAEEEEEALRPMPFACPFWSEKRPQVVVVLFSRRLHPPLLPPHQQQQPTLFPSLHQEAVAASS